MKTSWKTTMLGVIAAVPIILSEIKSVIDDDPETNLQVENIVAALALMGFGAAARDANKSSQDHQIR